MVVPKSLKLAEAELSSMAQLDHQLAAAARPGVSIRELVRGAGAIEPSDHRPIGKPPKARGES